MSAYTYAAIVNVAILLCIGACTASIAYWAHNGDGLFSLVLIFAWISVNRKVSR